MTEYTPPALILRSLLSGALLCHSFDVTGIGQDDFTDTGDFDWN